MLFDSVPGHLVFRRLPPPRTPDLFHFVPIPQSRLVGVCLILDWFRSAFRDLGTVSESRSGIAHFAARSPAGAVDGRSVLPGQQ